ncbi:SDR family NAD(P)-dependent oxidoreductase, partial [Nonomuraea sp. NPDC050451]|uniref:SDR family NAD(P)-dependent oxidoreductase n=1 Tax=Nonomuraea sp. NPDC050451 TaxID=3364364 RepID=UPI0037BBE44A
THTTITPTLRKNHPEPHTLLHAIATTHTHNHNTTINWHNLITHATTTDLPTYPFQHHHYWLEPPSHGRGAEGPRDDGFWKALESEETEALASRLKVDAEALRTVLPALSTLRDAERKRSVLDDWRYKLVWRGVSAPSAAGITGTAWLVAVPAAGGDPRIIRDVLDGLSRQAARVYPLVVGGEDRAALADAIRAEARSGLTGVLCLLPLDDEPHEEHPTLSRGAAATVTLVQALADAEVSAPLWLATSGAFALDEPTNSGATNGRATQDRATDGGAAQDRATEDRAAEGRAAETVSPFQTSLWGLGAVLAVDHPDTWGGIVDLPAEPGAEDLALLQGVLAGTSGEDQVAIRSGVVRARRMVRSPNGGADRARSWKPTGTVLVTGGTSGVGANVARWLAREGAERLVLVSRRGRGAEGVAELEAELTGLGAAVTVAACDVADRAAVRDLLESIPDLTAVMHAAGVGHDDMLVADTTLEDFAGYARSKVIGAINLDELLGDRPLEAFVMFSSGAAVWGSSGQASYAAANGFLDGLAQRRRSRGLAGSSIAWGGWGGGGMMEDAGEQLGRSGLRPMAPDAAAMAIGQLVGSGEGHLVVTDIDWERFAPAFALARPRPLVSAVPEFTRALDAPAAAGDDDDGTAFAARLAELPPAKRERLVVSLVRAEAAAVLGHTSDDPVQPDRAFNELGFDSLTAVELRNRLGRATGLKLPATLVFDYPTPLALARFVQDRLSPETPSGSIFAQLDEMERLLREQALSAGDRAQISDRFRAILLAAEGVNGAAEEVDQDLDDLSDEELFAALDDQLGAS